MIPRPLALLIFSMAVFGCAKEKEVEYDYSHCKKPIIFHIGDKVRLDNPAYPYHGAKAVVENWFHWSKSQGHCERYVYKVKFMANGETLIGLDPNEMTKIK